MTRTLIIVLLCASIELFAADDKTINISNVNEEVKIDGELTEAFWQEAEIATDFIQNEPRTGEPSTRKTEVRIGYDNQAIYIGAIMYDERDSMTMTLSQRDDLGNADWFGVVFDPYNAGTIGFAFLVTSAGVQVDELHQVENIDANWNAVWQSEVSILEDRWIAEIKIPFSALRFPAGLNNDWGVTFARNIRRKREQSFWRFYDPAGINLISQLGILQGIKDVEAPLRLSFTPYASAYLENYEGTTNFTQNAGMDLKWGVNEAFTVDMTLIPDFGQVQFDNQVLNLSPFEVYYNERRQFFTEGTELFNKAGIFYSRRVGSTPVNYGAAYSDLDSNEQVVSNPETSQLLNATKFSGRTKKGTGIGVFNGITGRMNATVQNTETGEARTVETGPLTNYNLFVFDQNLKNNSSVTLTNANVWREGHTYDANVTSGIIDWWTKGQKYNLWAIGNVSNKIYENDNTFGHQIDLGARKSAGNFLYGTSYNESSRTYDPNDLGFQTRNNIRTGSVFLNYNIYKPFWRLFRLWSGASAYYQRLVNPDAFANFYMLGDVGMVFRNYMAAGAWCQIEPIITYDFFEPRVAGRYYEYPKNFRGGLWISSDYSKPFALDMSVNAAKFIDDGRYTADFSVSPRIRFNDKFFLVFNSWFSHQENEEGAALDVGFSVPFDGDDPIFAIRDRQTVENTIDASYIFTNRMGLTFRLRHYWSKVSHDAFYALDDAGRFKETTYTGFNEDGISLHDNSFNAFTIDMVYRWVFAPGSELSLVWKNSIFNFGQEVQANYFQNVGTMLDNPATNSISLKVLYYIDAWQVKQNLFNNKI